MDITLLGAALGASMVVLGAAYGISKIGANAMESIARQPEAADSIRNAMIVAAGLIEGIAIIGAIVCLLIVFK